MSSDLTFITNEQGKHLGANHGNELRQGAEAKIHAFIQMWFLAAEGTGGVRG